MRQVTTLQRIGIAGAGTLGLYLLYGVSGLHTAHYTATAWHLHTPLDDLVPFQPAATLAYLLLVAQVYAPIVMVDDWRVIVRGAAGLVGMIGTFLVVWLLFPVTEGVGTCLLSFAKTTVRPTQKIRWASPEGQ